MSMGCISFTREQGKPWHLLICSGSQVHVRTLEAPDQVYHTVLDGSTQLYVAVAEPAGRIVYTAVGAVAKVSTE